MKKTNQKYTPRAVARAKQRQAESNYLLRLYVSDMSLRSTLTVENVHSICEEYLPGRYRLEVIDIYQNPARMRADQVVAAPTLIKRGPEPVRRLVGDMSDRERVLVGLGLKPQTA